MKCRPRCHSWVSAFLAVMACIPQPLCAWPQLMFFPDSCTVSRRSSCQQDRWPSLVSFLSLGHTWRMGYCCSLQRLSVHPSIRLFIQFLLAYIHDWHQTISAYLPCPVLVSHTIILDLWPLTLAWWPLPCLRLLLQNCLNKTYHQCQNGTFAAFCQYLRWVRRAVTLVDLWPTFQGQIDHHDLGLCLLVQYCFNKTSDQCQNSTFGEFYQYLRWVLTVDLLFKVREVILNCLSVHPISPSLYAWLTSTITAYLPCPVLAPHTIILALRTLTVAWWPWPWLCLLP